jgi:hypothetical protein
MPKGSAVAKVESKLKKEYPGNPGAVYGTLNKAGLMHGNKPTAKGLKKAEPDKNARDKASPRPAKPRAGRPGRGRGI